MYEKFVYKIIYKNNQDIILYRALAQKLFCEGEIGTESFLYSSTGHCHLCKFSS